MKACAPGMCEGRRCWLPTLTGLRPHPPRVCGGEGRCFHLVVLLCHLYHVASRTCISSGKRDGRRRLTLNGPGQEVTTGTRPELKSWPHLLARGAQSVGEQGDIFSPTICATRINTEVVHVAHGQGQPTRVFCLRKESKALVANI